MFKYLLFFFVLIICSCDENSTEPEDEIPYTSNQNAGLILAV